MLFRQTRAPPRQLLQSPEEPTKSTKAAVQIVPLQIRLQREEVKAIKVAAAEREQTISDFMLACLHAFMKQMQ
jgi:hypothetical protein